MSSDCHKNCGCSKPCGCGDNVLTTAPTQNCPAVGCANPNKCAETYGSDCVLYTGDTIANLNIYKGQPLTEILQKLTLLIVNPGCAYPTSTCQSVLNLVTTAITNATVNLYWNVSGTAASYQIEYRKTTVPSWTLLPTTTLNTGAIGGLSPNTNYYIRVNALCTTGSCYSVTLEIKTKI